MGLASALNTALTGLSAAETTIDVVGNNVANANTVGFKSSEAVFATQFLQTQALGSAPTGNSGGTNPRQVGLGTQVAAITPDFTQGTIEISSNASDLAIQGDGFFIVEAGQGEQLFTRNGIFSLNAENQLVTTTGHRLVGHGVDQNFTLQTTELVPLEVPVGSAAVAQATENVFLEGSLIPDGVVATTGQIVESGILGDASFTAPTTAATPTLSAPADLTATTLTPSGAGGGLTGGTYQYRVTFVDASGTESTPSAPISIVATGSEDTITVGSIPAGPAGTVSRNVYRTVADGTAFHLVGNTAGASLPDSTTDAALPGNPALDESTISGNYSYFVTFTDALGGPPTGIESRPSPVVGPLNIVDGRVQLDGIPTDSSGQWVGRRLYRNLATDENTFHFVGEIGNNTSTSYTDNASDTTIAANTEIDFDGPRATSNTLLTDVLTRDGTTFDNAFQAGTLNFVGLKGGAATHSATDDPNTLAIGAASTVLDLISFMEQSFGIQEVPGPDSSNPIPTDSSGAAPGASITGDGRIRFVSNNGVSNAVSVPLSALSLDTGTDVDSVNLAFGTTQEAAGESAVTNFVVFDSLGIAIDVRVTAVLESVSSTQAVYRWFADSPDNGPTTGNDISVGTGLIRFDGEGNFLSTTNSTVSIERRNVPSASPLEFEFDFNNVRGLPNGDDGSQIASSRQDGSSPGTLSSYIIGEDGTIRGVFSNGISRDLGQIRLARFANPEGLEQRGENLFAGGVNSGLPVEGVPGGQGIGTVIAGALELSNTDIGQNLIELILASTQYRGNTRVITTAQQLLDELLNLRR